MKPKKRKAGRPKGSKNKSKAATMNVSQMGYHFATVFIARFGINDAEKLAQRILEQIRAKKNNGKEIGL